MSRGLSPGARIQFTGGIDSYLAVGEWLMLVESTLSAGERYGFRAPLMLISAERGLTAAVRPGDWIRYDGQGVFTVEPASEFPRCEGDTVVIGPECFASLDGSVLCWKGENYVRQSTADAALVRIAAAVETLVEQLRPPVTTVAYRAFDRPGPVSLHGP